MADTGCGNDLIPRAIVESADFPVTSVPDASVQFQTANGTAEAAEVADVQVAELDEIVSSYIVEEAPGECPYFVRPDGYWAHLRVLGNVPSLVPGANWCRPLKPPSPCAAAEMSDPPDQGPGGSEAAGTIRLSDEWCCMGLTWARVHHGSRIALFTPVGVNGGLSLDSIGAKRITVVW